MSCVKKCPGEFLTTDGTGVDLVELKKWYQDPTLAIPVRFFNFNFFSPFSRTQLVRLKKSNILIYNFLAPADWTTTKFECMPN